MFIREVIAREDVSLSLSLLSFINQVGLWVAGCSRRAYLRVYRCQCIVRVYIVCQLSWALTFCLFVRGKS